MRSGGSEDVRILSVDVGSSSVRAELFDGSGDPEEGTETKLGYELEYTAEGAVTKEADELNRTIAKDLGLLKR